MDKIRRDKRREVHTRLDFGEDSRKSQRMREDSQNSSAKTLSARYRNPSERPQIRDRLRNNDGNVFGRDDSYSRGRPHKRNSSPSRDYPRSGDRSHGIKESYGNTYSSHRTGDKHRYHSHGTRRSSSIKREGIVNPRYLACQGVAPVKEDTESQSQKRGKPTDEEDLAVIPNNVKTYDGTGDPEDHVKIFQAAAQVERWAMPTWRNMFNSTLIGTARVWFDELHPKSIDGYKDLKAAFLAYFMQQKKYVNDPVEIHNIKHRDGETIEDFIERFKIETRRRKGDPECMRIFEFMHEVNNPELTKRLNEHVPKTPEEIMTSTATFIQGETAAASQKKAHTPWKS
nr:reverse transcriptase domain-containing protein [Tanacetum cinerariifolium]